MVINLDVLINIFNVYEGHFSFKVILFFHFWRRDAE